MNLMRIGALSALVVAAMGITAGTSYANPADAAIGYEAKLLDKTVVTTLTGGTFDIKEDRSAVEIKDKFGATVVSLPLSYNLDGLQFPIEAAVEDAGKELNLKPVTDVARAVPRAALHDVASATENQMAMGAFSSQLGIAMAVGGLVGLTAGAVAGGLLGLAGIVGGPVVIPAVLTGIALGAGAGSIIGTISAGGPTLVIAGIDLANTLMAPPGTTKFAAG